MSLFNWRKTMLIKMTHKTDDKSIYINTKAIVAFDEAKDGVGTRIVFDSDFAYEVKESVDAVKDAVKCCGLFCHNG